MNFQVNWEIFIDGIWSGIEDDTPEGAEYLEDSEWLVISDILEAGDYEYRCISEGDCQDTSQIFTLSVIQTPEVLFDLTENLICSGSEFELDVSSNIEDLEIVHQRIGSEFYTSDQDSVYSGMIADLLVNLTDSIVIVEYLLFGTHMGCPSDTSSFTISLVPTPSIEHAYITDSICSGELFEFSAESNILDAMISYEFLPGDYSLSGSPEGDVPIFTDISVQSEEIQQVYVALSSEYNGCAGAKDTLEVIVVPIAEIIGLEDEYQLCSGEVFELELATNLDQGFVLFELLESDDYWSPEPLNGSVQISDTLISQIDGTTAVFYELISSNFGCQGEIISLEVTLNSIPEIVLDETDFSICSGSLFEFDILSSVQESIDGYSREESNEFFQGSEWSQGTDEINEILMVFGNDPYVVEYEIYSEFNECFSDTTIISVQINPTPQISLGAFDAVQCEGNPLVIPILSSTEQAEVNWFRVFNEFIAPDVAEGTGSVYDDLENMTVLDIEVDYQITVAIDDCPGNQLNVSVIVQPGPDITVSGDEVICQGESIQIFAAGGLYYEWSPESDLNFPFVQDPVATPSITTDFEVSAYGPNGCHNRDTVTVEILEAPNVNVGEDLTSCFGDTITLYPSGAIDYFWDQYIWFIDPQNSTQPSLIVEGDIILVVEGFDSIGCSGVDTLNITMNPSPDISIAGEDEICQGESSQLTAEGAIIYQWSPIDNLDDPTTSNPLASPLVTTSYQVVGTNEFGCSSIEYFTLSVNDAPYGNLSGDDLVCSNSFWNLYESGSNAFGYNWDISGGEFMTPANGNNVWVNWEAVGFGEISVLVTNPVNGCSKTESMPVDISAQLASDTTEIILLGDGLLYSVDSLFSTYIWGYEDLNHENQITTCEDSQYCYFEALNTDQYYYWVIHGNDQACLTKSYYNNPIVNLNELNNESARFLAYPNPTSDYLVIESLSDKGLRGSHILITDLFGKVIRSQIIANHDLKLDVSGLHSGVYLVKITGDDTVVVRVVID